MSYDKIGHGPLADRTRFAGCRGDCWQGRDNCETPGQCFVLESDDSDPFAAARSIVIWCGVTGAVVLLVSLLVVML